jgi:hypothetical protein
MAEAKENKNKNIFCFVKNRLSQGILTEGEGLVQLTSSLVQLVL